MYTPRQAQADSTCARFYSRRLWKTRGQRSEVGGRCRWLARAGSSTHVHSTTTKTHPLSTTLRGSAAAHRGKPPAYRRGSLTIRRLRLRPSEAQPQKNKMMLARKAGGFPPCAVAKPQK